MSPCDVFLRWVDFTCIQETQGKRRKKQKQKQQKNKTKQNKRPANKTNVYISNQQNYQQTHYHKYTSIYETLRLTFFGLLNILFGTAFVASVGPLGGEASSSSLSVKSNSSLERLDDLSGTDFAGLDDWDVFADLDSKASLATLVCNVLADEEEFTWCLLWSELFCVLLVVAWALFVLDALLRVVGDPGGELGGDELADDGADFCLAVWLPDLFPTSYLEVLCTLSSLFSLPEELTCVLLSISESELLNIALLACLTLLGAVCNFFGEVLGGKPPGDSGLPEDLVWILFSASHWAILCLVWRMFSSARGDEGSTKLSVSLLTLLAWLFLEAEGRRDGERGVSSSLLKLKGSSLPLAILLRFGLSNVSISDAVRLVVLGDEGAFTCFVGDGLLRDALVGLGEGDNWIVPRLVVLVSTSSSSNWRLAFDGSCPPFFPYVFAVYRGIFQYSLHMNHRIHQISSISKSKTITSVTLWVVFLQIKNQSCKYRRSCGEKQKKVWLISNQNKIVFTLSPMLQHTNVE